MSISLLSGLKVLEYAGLVSGPYCGKLLGDLGAEVIKVEPLDGDVSRRRGPFPADVPDAEKSLPFHYLNVNKKGVTLNLGEASGRKLFRELTLSADVLIEDTPPGSLDAMSLGYGDLEKENPGLVMLSITPFGQYGPHRDWKAYNLNTTHIGGEGWLTPPGLAQRLFPDREPLKSGGYIGDYYCGVTAAAAAVIGAMGRLANGGRGQHVDLSKQEAHATLVRIAISLFANSGDLETRVTRDIEYSGCIPCKDGYVEINVILGGHWVPFVKMMGEPAWTKEDRFADHASRSLRGDEVNEKIMAWAKDLTRAEIFELGRRYGVPVGPFLAPREVLASSHEAAREFFVPAQNPQIPELRLLPSSPFRFRSMPYGVPRPAPKLGEHNHKVFGEMLGLGPEELTRLRRACVI